MLNFSVNKASFDAGQVLGALYYKTPNLSNKTNLYFVFTAPLKRVCAKVDAQHREGDASRSNTVKWHVRI